MCIQFIHWSPLPIAEARLRSVIFFKGSKVPPFFAKTGDVLRQTIRSEISLKSKAASSQFLHNSAKKSNFLMGVSSVKISLLVKVP